MADVIFVFGAVGFFGLCVAYLRALDRLVRSPEDLRSGDVSPSVEEVGG